MKFVNPLPFVTDIDRSKRFYSDVPGLRVLEDHGDFVGMKTALPCTMPCRFIELSSGRTRDDHAPYGRRNFVLYFEVDDIDAAFNRISSQVELIHPVETQAWGQRVFRLYDPDEHIVEVGEPQR